MAKMRKILEKNAWPVLIIDMLLINYFLELAKETKKSFTEVFNDLSNEIRSIYPTSHWKNRLDKLDLTAMRVEEEEEAYASTINIPGLGSIVQTANGNQNSDTWKKAIEAWTNWYKAKKREFRNGKSKTFASQHQLGE